ncbi:MAG: hypothetical protein CMI18_10455 [Opitutaceae bacterium]|nr:hypothetical protein [Opitutaceae bacterium]
MLPIQWIDPAVWTGLYFHYQGEKKVPGGPLGLQNRCQSVDQAEVGSIPTLSANIDLKSGI